VEIIMISDKIDDKIYCVCMIKIYWRSMIKIDDKIYWMWKLLWSVIRLMIIFIVCVWSKFIEDQWLRFMIRFIVCGNYCDQW
jgi:hypothetical protein